MAHSLSSRKRIRQNVKRRLVNKSRRTVLKGKLKDCGEQLLHGTVDAAAASIQTASRALDRMANARTIHRNAAARRKSRLMKRLNAMKAKAATAK